MQTKFMLIGLFIISLVLGHWLFNLALETTDTEESSTKPITTEEIVEILRKQLQSAQPNVRQATALALGKKGPAAKSAVDDLKVLLVGDEDKDRTVQAAAGWALCKIEPDSPEKLDWLAKALRGQDFNSQVRASELVKDFGPAAVPLGPELAETLRHPNGGWKSVHFMNAMYSFVGPELLPHLQKARATAGLKYRQNLDLHIRNLQQLKRFKIRPVFSDSSSEDSRITELRTIVEETRKATRRATQALGNTPADRLTSKDVMIRRKAAKGLIRIIQEKELDLQVFRPLEKAMEEDPDEEVRLYAAIALSRIEPGYQKPIPFLVKALEHKNQKIRIYALRGVVDCGPGASSALPILVRMLLNFSGNIDRNKPNYGALQREKWLVFQAVSATVPYISNVLPELIQGATYRGNTDTIMMNNRILDIIGKAGPAAEAASSALINIWILYDSEARALIQEAAKENAPDRYKRNWRGEIESMKKNVYKALERINIGSGEFILMGMRYLREDTMGELGVEIIRNIGAPAFEPLGQCLDDSDQDFRRRVIKCLSFVGPQAIPLLKKTMKTDSDRNVRLAAAQALKKLEVDISDEQLRELRGEKVAKSHRPRTQSERIALLVATAVNPEEPIQARRFACRGLKRIGQPAAMALCRIVEDTDKPAETRCRAEMVLAWMGPAANSAVPALIGALKDSNSSIRANAAFALGRIGPRAKTAISALEKAMQDPNELVRDKAETALRKIDPKGRVYIKPSAPEK